MIASSPVISRNSEL